MKRRIYLSLFLISLLGILQKGFSVNKTHHLKPSIAEVTHQQSKTTQHSPTTENRILYYTCGMHPQTKVSVEEYKKGKTKDPICGMDLVPVYLKDVAEKGIVKLDEEQISLASIQTKEVKKIPLFKEIRTVGVVAYDPYLRVAEEEYIQALKAYEEISLSSNEDAKERAKEILQSAKLKLQVLGLTEEWIKELQIKKIPHQSLILPDKYMWVYADIYEYEALWPKIGNSVQILSEVDPSLVMEGTIKAIEPVVKENTRTLKLKILVENKNNLLKPNMYVDVFLKTDVGKKLAIPYSAVLDTGKRKIAFVDLGEGRYQLREIRIGPKVSALMHSHKQNFYILEEGIEEGERVVVKGNYLLDSQSQLGAAGAAYGGSLEAEKPKVHQH